MWKIVIIDDDRQVLKGMKQVIPWEDIGAVWAGEGMTGAEGLELIRQTRPDIIITDVYMPVMDGLKMIEILREELYAGKILIHSGYSDFEFARKALRLNVDDYLSKPVSKLTIREVLLRVIGDLEEEDRKKADHEKLRDTLMLYEPFVRKERLKTAIIGTWESETRNDSLFPNDEPCSHLVLGMEIVRTPRISSVRASDRYLFRFAIHNIIQEILRAENACFDYVELHGYQSAVILHFKKAAGYDEMITGLRKTAKRITECVHNYLNIKVRIGIGGLKESGAALSDSLEEAFQFLSEEAPGIPSSEPYEYNRSFELPGQINPPSVKPMRFYHQLIEDLKNTQGRNAEKIIRSYVSGLKGSRAYSSPQLQMIGTQFWAILRYTLNDEEIRLEDIYPEAQIEFEVNRFSTADQLEFWLIEKISGIFNNRHWQENMKHKRTIDFIKQYIHENYDRELTIAELAEKVLLSRNYLCQIFKNATGETINNYIVRVRMEKAKGLLLEGKLKIYEIADCVGYRNIPYFSTTFKRYFGVTPADVNR